MSALPFSPRAPEGPRRPTQRRPFDSARDFLLRPLVVLAALLWVMGCAAPEDNPTTVKDLRVLGIQLDPPDLMAPRCLLGSSASSIDPQELVVYASPVRLTALIADPAGEGRDLSYELRACAWTGDRRCDHEVDSAPVRTTAGAIASGTTKGGELVLNIVPGATVLQRRRLEDVTGGATNTPQPLLLQVFEQDTYKGLGGLRMPLVLHLKAGDEEIYAQKLMVFSCNFGGSLPEFPQMTPNVNPALPGLVLEDEPWTDAPVRELKGAGPFKLRPEDFTSRQEPYTVASFELKPVQLEEAWKLSWHATYGRMSPGETGGVDPDGVTSRHNVEWTPPSDAEAKIVEFFIVARDGRGGTSWLRRTVNYVP